MEVSINERYFSEQKREYMLDLAQWAGIKLMGPRLSKNISVTINSMKSEDYRKGTMYGFTEIVDEDEFKKNPRNFVITITNRVGIMRTLVILAHEMVHVKQHARNELLYSNRLNDTWMGKPIRVDNFNYWDLPYEIEAHGREKGLVYQWCDARKLCKESWYRRVF